MRTFKTSPIQFTHDGRPMEGQEGDSVASALFAAGVRIFSRSFQYHRPRGLFCVNGRCVNCAVRINGRPHMRACTVRLERGMKIESEGAWPSMRFDFFRMIDFFHVLFPPGFQYRYFIRPRWLFGIWERLLRQMAAHAAVPTPDANDGGTPQYLKEAADLVVVGGGPAGLAAALSGGRHGLRVALIDDHAELGGSLHVKHSAYHSNRSAFVEFQKLVQEVSSLKNVTIHHETRCFAYYGDGPVAAFRGSTLIELDAKAVVIATGAYERPLIFGNNDLPGIFLSSGALRLLRQHDVRPGTRAVVATTIDDGFEVASELLDAGLHVEAVVDSRTGAASSSVQQLRQRGVKILEGHRIEQAYGLGRINAVKVAPAVESRNQTTQKLPCDVLVTCGGFQPSNELCFQATSQGNFLMEGPGGWKDVVQGQRQITSRDGTPLFIAGNAACIGGLEKSLHEGKIAGLAAALKIAGKTETLVNELQRERDALAGLRDG